MRSVTGGKVPHFGEKHVYYVAEDGGDLTIKYQVGNVTKPVSSAVASAGTSARVCVTFRRFQSFKSRLKE